RVADHHAARPVVDLHRDTAGALLLVVRRVPLVVEPRVAQHAAGAEHRHQERKREQDRRPAVAPAPLLPLADAPLVPPAQPLLRRRPPVAVRIRAKVQVVHELPRTISPGGLPANRSASSAACSSTAAAAWSPTVRAARPGPPPARRPRSAGTVVSLSPYTRTAPAGGRPASRTATLRAASAAGPSRPDSDVASPTTTSFASCS